MGPHCIQQDKTTSDAQRTRHPTNIDYGGKQTVIDMQAWADYYTAPDIASKIAFQCRYREVVIIQQISDKKITLRPIKIFKPEHVEFWMERLNLKTTLFDLYISNASVKLPQLPSDIYKLKETREYLSEHWHELMTGYDIFGDIDIEKEEDRVKAKEYAITLTNELKKRGYAKTELWDTSRGFHVIDKGMFKPEFVKDLIMDICLNLDIPMSYPVKTIDGERYVAKDRKWVKMKPKEDVPDVAKPNSDTSIWDIRRIRRVPFSLHSKTGKPMVRLL